MSEKKPKYKTKYYKETMDLGYPLHDLFSVLVICLLPLQLHRLNLIESLLHSSQTVDDGSDGPLHCV